MRIALPLVLLSLLGAGCASLEADTDDAFLGCAGKCDSAGQLTLSDTWVPVGGFVRAVGVGEIEAGPSASIDQLSADRHLVRFDEAGMHEVRLSTAGGVAGRLLVRVSDEGPSLELLSPEPGSFVTLDGRREVEVRGRIVDPLAATRSARIGDRELALSSDGSFDTTLIVEPGVAFVAVTTTDTAGNVFESAAAFLAADRFGEVSHRLVMHLDDRALRRLTDELQDGLPGILRPRAPRDPVYESFGNEVYIDEFILPGQGDNPGSISLTWQSGAGGALRVTVDAEGNAYADGRVDAWVDVDPYRVTLTDLHIEFDLAVENTSEGIVANVENVTASSASQTIEVDATLPDGVYEWMAGDLDEHVVSALNGVLGPAITKALSSVEGNIPVTGASGVAAEPVLLNYELAELGGNSGWTSVGVELIGSGPAVRYLPGAPLIDEADVNQLPTNGDMGINVSYNAFNQFLARSWSSDAMRWQLSETDPMLADALADVPSIGRLNPIVEIGVDIGLPPFASDGSGDAMALSVGAVSLSIFLHTDLFQVTVEAQLGARADISFETVDGHLRPVPQITELHVDLSQRGVAGLDTEALEQLIAELAPGLLAKIAESIDGFPLPSFDLGRVGFPDNHLGLKTARATGTPHGLYLEGEMGVLEAPIPQPGG